MSKILNFDLLAALARRNQAITLSASAECAGKEEPEIRELTGEDILAAVAAAGGTVHSIERDEDTGIITSIEASGAPSTCEYEPEEMQEVLESLQATAVTPSKLTGDLAQTSINSTLNITGSTTSASAVITSPSSTAGLAVGQPISGAGIPANTTIASLSPLTMSASATATASSIAIAVEAEQQILCLSEWTLSWKRKTVDSTTTDDGGAESAMGSTSSWTAKAKFAFLDGDPSQTANILAAITTAAGASTWNFFPTIAVGRSGFQGKAWIDGIDTSAGVGKLVGLDVSLKGTGLLTNMTQLAPITSSTTTQQQAEE